MHGSKVGDTAIRKPIWRCCSRGAASQCSVESSVRRTNTSSCHLLFLCSCWDFSCSHVSNSSDKPSLLADQLADAAVSKCLSVFPLLCFCSKHIFTLIRLLSALSLSACTRTCRLTEHSRTQLCAPQCYEKNLSVQLLPVNCTH